MKYLICGLGNPGPEYELTRHNIGFLVLDRLADRQGVSFKQDRHGWMCELKHKGRRIILLKPSTYMNLSGKAVNFWLQQEKIPLENCMIVTDDIALPFGKLRLRPKGSSGGHNGLENIRQVLGTDAFCRLRFGVGGDFPKGKQVDYVLGSFSREELDALPALMDKIGDGIFSFTTIGIEKTMNFINAR